MTDGSRGIARSMDGDIPDKGRVRMRAPRLLLGQPGRMDPSGSTAAAARTESILARLIGVELTQVWFVMDHLQLIFGADDSLQCFVWPRIETDERTLTIATPGYRDELCAFLTTEVTAVVEDPAIGLAVEFAAGRIVLAPTREELVGPEIAMFHNISPTNRKWQVWEPGDKVFPHLA